jgi:hypothetical protein
MKQFDPITGELKSRGGRKKAPAAPLLLVAGGKP